MTYVIGNKTSRDQHSPAALAMKAMAMKDVAEGGHHFALHEFIAEAASHPEVLTVVFRAVVLPFLLEKAACFQAFAAF